MFNSTEKSIPWVLLEFSRESLILLNNYLLPSS